VSAEELRASINRAAGMPPSGEPTSAALRRVTDERDAANELTDKIAVELRGVTKERDALARRCAVRFEETQALRQELAQYREALESARADRDAFSREREHQARGLIELRRELSEARTDADVARDQLAHCRCPDIDKETSMTGPEHYLEAERLLRPRTVQSIPSGRESQAPPTTDMILQAQVHATLALAAATALAAFDGSGMHADDFRAWDQTCGVNPGPAAFVQGVKAGAPDA
jgi:hypothetical protein